MHVVGGLRPIKYAYSKKERLSSPKAAPSFVMRESVYNVSESKIMVNGPSFTKLTFMSAPN